MLRATGMRSALFAALAAGVLGAAGVQAQQTAQLDPRWYTWIGCWEPEATQPGEGVAPVTVCVVPASAGTGVEVVTVERGAVVAREPMAATGRPEAAARESCAGSVTADWSADGRRVYRTSEVTCPGGFARKSTGVMAIAPTGEWIDVEALAAPVQETIRVLRYRPVMINADLPAEIRTALEGHAVASRTARLAASGQASLAEVAEVSARVGDAATEAWLVERGQGFGMELNAARLLAMKNAGVSGRVIDMVVALSYPERFAVNRESRDADPRQAETDRGTLASARRGFDPWGYYPTYGWGYYSRYGAYGYDSGLGYGYGPYGSIYGSPRVVVVVRDADDGETPASRPRGRMVNGAGYSRPEGSGPSSSTGSSGSSGSSGSGASSSGDSGSGGGSGTVRTAKPRD